MRLLFDPVRARALSLMSNVRRFVRAEVTYGRQCIAAYQWEKKCLIDLDSWLSCLRSRRYLPGPLTLPIENSFTME